MLSSLQVICFSSSTGAKAAKAAKATVSSVYSPLFELTILHACIVSILKMETPVLDSLQKREGGGGGTR